LWAFPGGRAETAVCRLSPSRWNRRLCGRRRIHAGRRDEFRDICGGGQFQQARVEFLGVLRSQSLHGLPSFPAQRLFALFRFGVQFFPAGGKPCHFGRVKSEFHVSQSFGDGGEHTKISSRKHPRLGLRQQLPRLATLDLADVAGGSDGQGGGFFYFRMA